MDDNRVNRDFRLCDDGVYRWVYVYDLWKNYTVILEIEKFFILACMGIMIILGLLEIPEKGLLKRLLSSAQEAGVILAVFTVLLLISYPIYCFLSNGKYCVLFEMDDKSIMHTTGNKHKVVNILTCFYVNIFSIQTFLIYLYTLFQRVLIDIRIIG